MIRLSVATKHISVIFYFGDLRSGQFCDLSIIRQYEKIQIPAIRIRPGSFIMNGVILGNFWWSRCKFCSVTVRVHLGSAEVTDRVLLITQDWKELQTWAWSHCAFLVKPHRLICSMTYLVQHVTLTWGQILTWLFKVTTYMFRRPLLRGSRWCSNFAAGFRS